MKEPMVNYIKADPHLEKPFSIYRDHTFLGGTMYGVHHGPNQKHANWYVTFNGNSKQRRQQKRKMLRELNQ